MIACPLADVGCGALLEPGTINEHLNDEAATHVSLLKSKFDIQKATNNHLKITLQISQNCCEKLRKERNSLRQENNKLNQENNKLNQTIERLNRKIKQQSENTEMQIPSTLFLHPLLNPYPVGQYHLNTSDEGIHTNFKEKGTDSEVDSVNCSALSTTSERSEKLFEEPGFSGETFEYVSDNVDEESEFSDWMPELESNPIEDRSIIKVKFMANDVDEWGCRAHFNMDLKQWEIRHTYPGKQAQRLGVQRQDRIIAIDGTALNENNWRSMEKKLIHGIACEITLLRDMKAEMAV